MERLDTKGYSEACVRFSFEVDFPQIPAATVEKIKLLTLDWIGCAVRGASTPHADPAKELYACKGGNPQAAVIGQDTLTNVVDAAFCNAFFGHIMEMDDVDSESISHPGTVVIPAALALSHWQGKSGKDFIAAVVAGYEVMLRIGAAVTPAHYDIWHTTATTGVFGSAMAAGKLLGLSREQMRWALGSAGTMSAGLWQFLHDGAASKFLHAGKASSDGVTAALLARWGCTGASRILEGEQGFFAGYARQEIDGDIFKDFGSRFRTDTVSIKPYPCCRHTHSTIDAADALRDKRSPEDIVAVTVNTYKTAIVIAGIDDPKTPQEAKFSLRYCVARALLGGILRDGDFSEKLLHDPAQRALMARVTIAEDPALTARMPAQWMSRVTARYVDGSEETVLIEAPKGDPGNPVSWDEAVHKFRLMTSGLLDEERIAETVRVCSALETAEYAAAALPRGFFLG